MNEFMDITRALSDETRVRVLLALQRQELCVCQVTELLGLAPSTVSKHLSILSQAGLLGSRKEGRWIFYSVPQKHAAVARHALDWVNKSLAETPQAAEDAKRLNQILKMDPVELCKRQCQRSKASTARAEYHTRSLS